MLLLPSILARGFLTLASAAQPAIGSVLHHGNSCVAAIVGRKSAKLTELASGVSSGGERLPKPHHTLNAFPLCLIFLLGRRRGNPERQSGFDLCSILGGYPIA
jgi:hypothetical protein